MLAGPEIFMPVAECGTMPLIATLRLSAESLGEAGRRKEESPMFVHFRIEVNRDGA